MNESIDDLFEAAVEEEVATIDPHDDERFYADLRKYRVARDLKDEHNAALSQINRDLDELEKRILDVMQARGLKSLNVEGVGKIGTAMNSYPKVLDFDGMVAWLDANGHAGIAKLAIHASTLRSFVKELSANGYELPPPDVMEPNSGLTLKLSRT